MAANKSLDESLLQCLWVDHGEFSRRFFQHDFQSYFRVFRYPTASLLADGRVMVTGAYSDHHTDTCYEVTFMISHITRQASHVTLPQATCLNPQINIFDPSTPNLFDISSSPWAVFIDKSVHEIASLINPGIREYTRVFTLPKPILAGKFMRHVLLFGKAGMIVLASLTPGVPMSDRLFVPPNGARPKANCGKDFSDQVLLISRFSDI
jgi:hypothetical protein